MGAIAYLRICAVLGTAAVLFFAPPAYAEKRVALVIGNSIYQNTPALANPGNDAEDLAAALTKVGFTVDLERNLTKKGMEDAIARFARLAQGADAALFFYAGHGMQYRGENYLMPVDARLEDEFSLNFELTRLDDVLFGLERAHGVKILVLDACRDNPLLEHLLRTTKSASRDLVATRGFTKVDAARGMLVAYSTQPNQVAMDGAGRNSPFTSALVKHIGEPGVEVGTLFRRVAIDVNRVTQGRQLPELSVSLVGEFYLNTQDTDAQAWSKLHGTDDAAKLNSFLKTYPTSPLTAEAREKLDAIERVERARKQQEQAELDRLEKERLAQEAERKRLDQERQQKAAQEQQEQLEKERLAQAQAARDEEKHKELARAQDERARLEREEAERQKAPASTPANPQIAMLTPPSETPANPPAPAKTVEIPSVLQCSPHSANPIIRPAFKADLTFSFSGGILKAERITKNPGPAVHGKEVYEGSVSSAGEIRINAHGSLDNGMSTWTSFFSGQALSSTTLTGRISLKSKKAEFTGFRTCTIVFQMPLPELRTKLGLLEANLPTEQKSPEINSESPAHPNKAKVDESSAEPKEIRNNAKIFSHEPPRGVNALHLGEIAYIDDDSCPEGQIKEMTGGSLRRGIDRRYRCVPRAPVFTKKRDNNKTASRSPTASARMGNATKESFKISGAGTIRTGQTVVLSAPNGRKMTCTGGSLTPPYSPRTCVWN